MRRPALPFAGALRMMVHLPAVVLGAGLQMPLARPDLAGTEAGAVIAHPVPCVPFVVAAFPPIPGTLLLAGLFLRRRTPGVARL